MKKRILSLVLCAAMLLSMCLFLGAGVAEDTTADGSAESTETVDGVNIVSFTNAGPLVKPEQTVGPAKVRALAANDTGSGVKLDKTVTEPDADGNYTVRLEAYATGEQTTTVSTKPCDIVLVLDVSGSMKDCIVCGGTIGRNSYHTTYTEVNSISNSTTYYIKNGSGYTEVKYCNGKNHITGACSGGPGWYTGVYRWDHTPENKITPKDSTHPNGTQFFERSEEDCSSRLSALKTAVNTFIDQVAAKEAADGVKHYISIVKFAGNKNDEVGDDTYNTYNGGEYNYSQIVKGLTDAKAHQKDLKDAVNALSAGGVTRADFGMQHAQSILSNRPADRMDASKVVVMFTDGEPTNGSSFEESVANSAINASYALKKDGVTVYTVGCMDGADASRVDNISTLGNTNVNKYMHLVSSNYKNAKSMSNPGDATYPKDTSESYYLAARNADDLKNVFESISSQVGGAGNTTLTDESILKDAVTPYFEIPADAKVTLKTADCTGVDNSGKLTFGKETDVPPGVKPTVNGNTVSVTGFDYSANWCGPRTNAAGSTTYSGKKLIVEFTIQPTAAFLGGNGVQTNVGTTDGIYAPGETTPVEKFQPQQVDVPVKAVEPKATGTEIYLGEKTDLADRVTTNIPQLDRVNNAYVDVTYTVTDENGQPVGTYTVPAGSSEGAWAWTNGSNVKPDKTTTYTVTSTSTPKTGDETNTASVEKQFTIKVNTCSLKITKTVKGEGANPNQTFVFNVMKGNDLVATVVLKAGQSTTITGLAVGEYTVAEDTAWSWSYTIHEGDQNKKVTLDKDNGYDREAKITNTAKENHWLTSIVDVINKWTAKDNIDNTGRVPGPGTN